MSIFRGFLFGRVPGDEDHGEPFVFPLRWNTFSGVEPSLDLRQRLALDDGLDIRVLAYAWKLSSVTLGPAKCTHSHLLNLSSITNSKSVVFRCGTPSLNVDWIAAAVESITSSHIKEVRPHITAGPRLRCPVIDHGVQVGVAVGENA